MTKRLSDMHIREISAVTKGANRKQWLICKGEEDMGEPVLKTADIIQVGVEALGLAIEKTFDGEISKQEEDIKASFDQFVDFVKENTGVSFEENIRARDLRDHMWSATDALFDAIRSTMDNTDLDADGKKAKIAKDVDDFSTWVKEMLDVHDIAKSGAAISADRLKRLKEMHTNLGAVIAEADKAEAGGSIEKGDDTTMKAEDITKMVTDAMAPIVTRIEALEKGDGGGGKPAAEPPADDVTKAVTEAVTKAMEPLVARIEVVEKAKGIKKSLEGGGDGEGGQEPVKKSMWEGLL